MMEYGALSSGKLSRFLSRFLVLLIRGMIPRTIGTTVHRSVCEVFPVQDKPIWRTFPPATYGGSVRVCCLACGELRGCNDASSPAPSGAGQSVRKRPRDLRLADRAGPPDRAPAHQLARLQWPGRLPWRFLRGLNRPC